jgi:hypothetical protein
MQFLPGLLRGVLEWSDFFDEDVVRGRPSYGCGHWCLG